jgi:hypothetical protein
MMGCAVLAANVQAKAVGSDFLWRRLQSLQPDLHVFGHSHFAWDAELEGEGGAMGEGGLHVFNPPAWLHVHVHMCMCACTCLHVFGHSHFAWDDELEGECMAEGNGDFARMLLACICTGLHVLDTATLLEMQS